MELFLAPIAILEYNIGKGGESCNYIEIELEASSMKRGKAKSYVGLQECPCCGEQAKFFEIPDVDCETGEPIYWPDFECENSACVAANPS